MNFKVRTKRTEQAKRVMCATDSDEETRNHIKKYLKIQQYGNYAAKALPIPFIYFLYTKNIFQLKSRSILRDFGVILGCIGWTEACEFGLSKFMWMNVESQVKAFGLLKRKEMEGRYKALIPKQRTELQNETDFMDDYGTNEQTATSKA